MGDHQLCFRARTQPGQTGAGGQGCRRKAAEGNNGINRINDMLEHVGEN